jgi:serine/threonine protein phosphatase PrpC
MQFESRVFQLAKDPEHPDENQDAYQVDARRGVAAIADGVASGIFSRQWARLLSEAVVADAPDPFDREAFGRWLAERRERWQEEIDVESLAWFQKPKLREGAFSTLLWVTLVEEGPDGDEGPGACRIQCLAVGDSCLLCLEDGRMVRSFPIERAEQFEADPVVVGSLDLGRDERIEFQSLEHPCREGDLVVLCTDAVADWALRAEESGNSPDWQTYWEMSEEDWQQQVDRLRADGQMRYDDATVVLLSVCRQGSASGAKADESPSVAGQGPSEVETAPAALPAAAADGDWRDTLKLLSEQVSDEVSGKVSKGMKKLKRARESAKSAFQKYRDKLRDNE